MVNNGMLICSFYLKKRFQRGDDELLPLNSEYEFKDEDENSRYFQDALDIMSQFCIESTEGADDEKSKKLFSIVEKSVQREDKAAYSTLSFIVSSGTYGIESTITDRRTRKVKYQCSEDDTPVKRFQCLIYIPKDTKKVQTTKGILIFQTLGTFGVKTITVKYMRAFCADVGLTLETRSVSVRTFIEKLIEKGSLYKVTLIRNRVSPDGADNMLISTGREERSYIHPRFKETWVEKFLNAINGVRDDDLLEFDDTLYEDITVTFKLGKNYRTVRLAEIDRFSVVEDIPEHVVQRSKTDEGCIKQYMLDTAVAYAKKMIFTAEET